MGVRARRIGVLWVLLTMSAGAVACGLGVTGAITADAAGDGGPGASDASVEAAVSTADGGGSGDTPAASNDDDGGTIIIGLDAGDDDGGGDAGCVTLPVLTDNFPTQLDPATWITTAQNDGDDHPKYFSNDNGYVSLIHAEQTGARGGIWLKKPVPSQSFDVKIQFSIGCDPGSFLSSAECADGMAIAWLPTNDPTILNTASTGQTFGIPSGQAGGALSVDIYKNSGEPSSAPFLAFLAYDAANAPGSLGAILPTASGQTRASDGNIHTLEVVSQAGMLKAYLDGYQVAQAMRPPAWDTFADGTFGVTAATGGEYSTYLIYNFAAQFSSCK